MNAILEMLLYLNVDLANGGLMYSAAVVCTRTRKIGRYFRGEQSVYGVLGRRCIDKRAGIWNTAMRALYCKPF